LVKIALIVGSVREQRLGIKVARWMEKKLKGRNHTVFFIDPLELNLITWPISLCILEVKLRPRKYTKFGFIQGEADKGNPLAKQYLEKLKNEKVSIDWAHKVLISSIRQQRLLKMMAIADDRHFSYDNEIELIQFIASEMEKKGLDVNNEENLDSYLNTKFM